MTFAVSSRFAGDASIHRAASSTAAVIARAVFGCLPTQSDVVPSTETISSGKYPVSRPLFFYVKKAHLGVIPGLKEYVEFFLNDQMIGEDSPLVEYGLVAAPEAERKAQRDAFAAGTTMKSK